jgi:ABC-type Mn2+/Zn2+ transport system ATPase subunit
MKSETPLVEAQDVSSGYGGKAAISGISFELRRGERLALLGPNGGGKSTLLRLLLGELRVFGGELRLNARLGSVAQTERTRLDYPVSVLDVALMGSLARLPWWRTPGRRERLQAAAALERVDLADLARETYGVLSGGQRQRVLIARALVQDAELLLLDEPFSGLDASSAGALETLIEDLADEGRAVIVAEHDFSRALRMDRVLCLNRRQVTFGSPAKVLDLATLERTYGASLVALPQADGAGPQLVLPAFHHEHAR